MSVPFNVSETIKRAEEEFGLGKGQYFKVQEGANVIRLLSPCVGFQGSYKGTPNFKFVCWVLDRRDGQIKLYFMPQTVLDGIGSLQMMPDYAFTEVPMPYDVAIVAKGAGTKDVQYSVVPSPKQTPLTPEEQAELDGKPTVDEVIEKLKEKQAGEQTGQVEQPQVAQQPQTGYEKAQARAASLPGARPAPIQQPASSEGLYDDIDVSDIPFS